MSAVENVVTPPEDGITTAKSSTAKKTATKKSSSKSKKKSAVTKKKTSAKAAAGKATAAKADTTQENDADVTQLDSSEDMARGPVVEVSMPQTEVRRYEREKDTSYMDESERVRFSKILQEWKQQLMEEVDRTVGHMKDDATNFPDPNDRATQEEEFSLELRTRDRERKLIKKINEAMKRIEDDEYGYCEACGIEIGVERLQARPTAELCIDCKTLEEIRERQIA